MALKKADKDDDFSIDIYKGNYPDLRKAFGNNNDAYVAHYLEYGLKEGRDGLEVLQDSKDNTSDDKKDDTNTGYVASAEEKKYSDVYDYIYYRNQQHFNILLTTEWQKDVRHVGTLM